MSSNSISPLILQNRLLSQARSGARTRNASIGNVLQNSSGNKSTTLDSIKKQAETRKNSLQDLEAKENYTVMKKAGENLKDHVEKLQEIYDREWDELTEEEAAKYRAQAEEEIAGFVDNYNTLIKTLSEESSSAGDIYLKQLKNYFQSSKAVLGEMGITQGDNEALSVDRKLLKAADNTVLQKNFGQKNSFASKVKERAENIISNAETNLAVINSSLYAGNYSYNKYGSDIFDILGESGNYNAIG